MINKLLLVRFRYRDGININLEKIERNILKFINLEHPNVDVKINYENQSIINHYNPENKIIFSSRIKKILNYVQKNYDYNITLEHASDLLNISMYYFEKIFSYEIGLSFIKYLNILRCCKAVELLRSNNNLSITSVCYDVGFNDFSNFIRQFRRFFGCSPKKFKNCCINPEKCLLRKKSYLFNLNNSDLNKAIGFPIKYICYIKR